MLTIIWRFIIYDWVKTTGVLAGIIICVFLIGSQLSIFFGMMGAMKGIAKMNPNRVWVIHKKTVAAMSLNSIDVREGNQLGSVPGVHKVYPVVVAAGNALFQNGLKQSIQLVGVASPWFVGGPTYTADSSSFFELMNEGAMMFDQSDQTMLGIQKGNFFTIYDQRVYVAGFAKNFVGFGNPYVLSTIERVRKICGINHQYVSAFILQVEPQNISSVMRTIDASMPGLQALTGSQFGDKTVAYMMKTSNIAMSFGMLVLFALVAGFTIVGLTFFSSVNDRIRDYGTIKAIGGSDQLIVQLICGQAIFYAIIGFVFAISLLFGFQSLMHGGKLEITLGIELISTLFGITMIISILGSFFALRKILILDPIQIFRM
jgi:putative ABC transport system permease protein